MLLDEPLRMRRLMVAQRQLTETVQAGRLPRGPQAGQQQPERSDLTGLPCG
ncbi:hypothetical protein ACFV98_05610 [Streptomyces violascens]|uniref:hypothetical protein n=1 Tax=Streptomyces violascens TaxID=67381 RepID=UPI00365972E6